MTYILLIIDDTSDNSLSTQVFEDEKQAMVAFEVEVSKQIKKWGEPTELGAFRNGNSVGFSDEAFHLTITVQKILKTEKLVLWRD